MKLGNVILGVVGRNGAADHLSGSRAHVRRVEDVNAIHYPLAEEGVPGHVAGYWSMFGISFSKPSGTHCRRARSDGAGQGAVGDGDGRRSKAPRQCRTQAGARGKSTLSIRRAAVTKGMVNDGGRDRPKRCDVIDEFK